MNYNTEIMTYKGQHDRMENYSIHVEGLHAYVGRIFEDRSFT